MSNKDDVLTYDDYVRGIDKLEPDQQLRLVELLSAKLKKQHGRMQGKHKITELEGLGAKVWKNVNAQEYIRKERNSWD